MTSSILVLSTPDVPHGNCLHSGLASRFTKFPVPIRQSSTGFALYSSKLILLADSSGSTKMRKSSQAKCAFSAANATVGLQVAIDAGDMAGALDAVDTSVARPAFR